MTVKERLAELERQHKALEHEIAEALGKSSVDDLKVKDLKRRKLMLKDEIARGPTVKCHFGPIASGVPITRRAFGA